jgi:outer membrane immunogenic protein
LTEESSCEAGYNWQIERQWLWGIEADFQGSTIRGNGNGGGFALVACCGDNITTTATASERLDWFGTVRGRIGWLPSQSLLLFATGGLAYGQITSQASFTAIGANPGGFIGTSTATSSITRAGWTIGGGLEWMIAPKWSIKGEYLYYDLGNVGGLNQTLTTITTGLGLPLAGASLVSNGSFHGSIARAALNYHFGGPAAATY